MRDGPVPADPGRDEPRPGWEPVITCPDPMTAEEWQAQLECEAMKKSWARHRAAYLEGSGRAA